MNEYARTKSLTERRQRDAAHMTSEHGYVVIRIMYFYTIRLPWTGGLSEIADSLQAPTDTKVCNVRWAKHHGNMYQSGLVVWIKVHYEFFRKSTMFL